MTSIFSRRAFIAGSVAAGAVLAGAAVADFTSNSGRMTLLEAVDAAGPVFLVDEIYDPLSLNVWWSEWNEGAADLAFEYYYNMRIDSSMEVDGNLTDEERGIVAEHADAVRGDRSSWVSSVWDLKYLGLFEDVVEEVSFVESYADAFGDDVYIKGAVRWLGAVEDMGATVRRTPPRSSCGDLMDALEDAGASKEVAREGVRSAWRATRCALNVSYDEGFGRGFGPWLYGGPVGWWSSRSWEEAARVYLMLEG